MIKEKKDVDHRQALRKRLAKAYKKRGLADEDESRSNKHHHSDHRPDPAAKLRLQAQELKSRHESEKQRALEVAKEIKERRSLQEKKREDRHRVFTSRTSKGQPKLSNQIGILLDKIQKS